MAFGEVGDVGQQPIPRAGLVDLVHRGDRRATRLHKPRQSEVVIRGPSEGLDHEHHQVGIFQCGRRGSVHRFVQCPAGVIVQSRGVYEGDLRIGQVRNAEDAMAGCLRPRGDDAELFTDQRVQQGRLADVGPADERREAAAKGVIHGRSQCSVSRVWRIFSAASCSARLRLEPVPCAWSVSSGTSQVT